MVMAEGPNCKEENSERKVEQFGFRGNREGNTVGQCGENVRGVGGVCQPGSPQLRVPETQLSVEDSTQET